MKNKKTFILLILLLLWLGSFLYNPSKNIIVSYKNRVNDPIKLSISGNIKWIDNNNINGKRPEEITISLYDFSFNKLEEQTITVTGDTQYSFTSTSGKVTVNRVEDYIVMIDANNNITYKYAPNNQTEYVTSFKNHFGLTINDENNEFLKGVEFSLKTIDGNNELQIIELTDRSSYVESFLINDSSFEDISTILSKTQLNMIKKIKTLKDLKKYLPPPQDEENLINLRIINKYGEPAIYYTLHLPTFLILEETKVPNGYVKEKYLIPAIYDIEYSLLESNINENNIDDSIIEIDSITILKHDDYSYFDYDDYNEEEYYGNDINNTFSLWQKNAREKECTNTLPGLFEEDLKRRTDPVDAKQLGSSDGCPIVLKAHKGEISLSVDNKVNEAKSLTTTTNTTLTYSVTLKNTGDIDAIDNTLTSKIPEGFKYVEGSASDGGEYKDGEIEWKVARVNSGAEKTYTFKVLVPKGTNITKDYIGESSVTSYSMQNRVDSDKTVVKLSLINPNTVTPITIIALVGISLIILIVLIINFYNNKKENQLYDNF